MEKHCNKLKSFKAAGRVRRPRMCVWGGLHSNRHRMGQSRWDYGTEFIQIQDATQHNLPSCFGENNHDRVDKVSRVATWKQEHGVVWRSWLYEMSVVQRVSTVRAKRFENDTTVHFDKVCSLESRRPYSRVLSGGSTQLKLFALFALKMNFYHWNHMSTAVQPQKDQLTSFQWHQGSHTLTQVWGWRSISGHLELDDGAIVPHLLVMVTKETRAAIIALHKKGLMGTFTAVIAPQSTVYRIIMVQLMPNRLQGP